MFKYCFFLDAVIYIYNCWKTSVAYNSSTLIWTEKRIKALITVSSCASTALSWSPSALEYIAHYHHGVKYTYAVTAVLYWRLESWIQ